MAFNSQGAHKKCVTVDQMWKETYGLHYFNLAHAHKQKFKFFCYDPF